MKIDLDTGKLIFERGRTISACRGVVGLNHDNSVFEGYDGLIHAESCDNSDSGLDRQERVELADHMISQWSKFRDRAKAKI